MNRMALLCSTAICALTLNVQAAVKPQMAEPIGALTIKVNAPMVKAVPIGQHRTSVFMDLVNEGDQERKVVAAVCPIAEQVQLHAILGASGMKPVQSISIKPHKQTDLRKNGFHLMLLGLRDKIFPGELLPITLIFDDGSNLTINAEVKRG